jgi:imidazolonepropionase
MLGVGRPANFVLWDIGTADELAYWLGRRPVAAVVRQGRIAQRAC